MKNLVKMMNYGTQYKIMSGTDGQPLLLEKQGKKITCNYLQVTCALVFKQSDNHTKSI